jgi:hypothetical protein
MRAPARSIPRSCSTCGSIPTCTASGSRWEKPTVTLSLRARFWQGREPHTFGDAEPDITELKSRIATAIDFVQDMPRGEIDSAADKEVAFRFRSGAERKFTGRSLLLTFSVPQFFFHVTTAYDILRHAGVELAKKDFLGPPRQA